MLAAEAAEIDQLEKQLTDLEGTLKGSEADLALLLGSSLPPPAGTAADIVSLGKSIGTGDWGGAFWDAIGFVPVVGDVAKGAVKGTKLASKIADLKKATKAAREKLAARRKASKDNAAKKCKQVDDGKKAKDKDANAAENCAKGDCGSDVKSSVTKKKNRTKPREPRVYEKKRRNIDGSTTYTLKTKNGKNVDVTYSKDGYPDFKPYKYTGKDGKAEVEIKMTGNNNTDFKSANQKSGFGNSARSHPEDYTWHHNENGKTMELVETDVHGAAPHTGGASGARGK